MSDALPKQPPTKEEQIAGLRAAEQAALEQVKADPMGTNSIPTDITQDDVELVAMLAGYTSKDMRRMSFADGTASKVASEVLDARAVVKDFVKSAGAVQPSSVVPRPIIQQPAAVIAPVVPKVDDPQLELDLYRKMNMTDVYNILAEMKSRLDEIESLQRTVLATLNTKP